MIYFFLGLFVGVLVSMLFLKHNLKKDGAGNLKICRDCPHKNVVKGGENNENAR